MNAGTWALVGLGLLVLGVVVTFAAASRGIAIQRSYAEILLDPTRNARRHGRAVNVARVALVAVLVGAGLLIGAGVAGLVELVT